MMVPARTATLLQPRKLVSGSGLREIEKLSAHCGTPPRLGAFNIHREAIQRMAASATTVTRLLDRNVRTVTEVNMISIYE